MHAVSAVKGPRRMSKRSAPVLMIIITVVVVVDVFFFIVLSLDSFVFVFSLSFAVVAVVVVVVVAEVMVTMTVDFSSGACSVAVLDDPSASAVALLSSGCCRGWRWLAFRRSTCQRRRKRLLMRLPGL
jgi:hypothetical protein